MNNPEKIEIHQGNDCPICGDTGHCSDCDRGIALAADELRKKEEAYEQENTTTEQHPVELIPVDERDDNWTSLIGGGK